MKNTSLFLLVLSMLLYGCALAPQEQAAIDRETAFSRHSQLRAQAMNEWWDHARR